jgi:hypothetical protein
VIRRRLPSEETNVFGILAVYQAMLPLLRESSDARIVNVSSGVGSLRIVTVLQRLRIRPAPSRRGQRNRNPVLIEVRRWVGSMRGPMHFTDRWVCKPTVGRPVNLSSTRDFVRHDNRSYHRRFSHSQQKEC